MYNKRVCSGIQVIRMLFWDQTLGECPWCRHPWLPIVCSNRFADADVPSATSRRRLEFKYNEAKSKARNRAIIYVSGKNMRNTCTHI